MMKMRERLRDLLADEWERSTWRQPASVALGAHDETAPELQRDLVARLL